MFEHIKVPWLVIAFFLPSSSLLAEIGGGDMDGGTSSSVIAKPSEFYLERSIPSPNLDVLSTNLAGENISLKDGGLTFSNSDISIKINKDLTYNLNREYDRLSGKDIRQSLAFGDWDIDLPRIEANVLAGDTRWSNNYYAESACSNALELGPIMGSMGQPYESYEYWNGVDLILPKIGGGKLHHFTRGYITDDNIKVTCKVGSDRNEYFYIETPDGLKFELKQRQLLESTTLVKDYKGASRYKLRYLISSVSDTYGNKLVYSYNTDYHMAYLSSVTYYSNGGAEELIASFNYDSDNRISSVNVGGKTYSYSYSGINLSKVTRPDGKYWQYTFPQFTNYFGAKIYTYGANGEKKCQYGSGTIENSPDLVIKHPDGAVITFNVAVKTHGNTEVPSSFMLYSGSSEVFNISACYGNIAVVSKSIDGIGLNDYKWTYSYLNDGSHWRSTATLGEIGRYNSNSLLDNEKNTKCASISECNAIPSGLGFDRYDLRVIKVINPDNTFIQYYISKRWDFTEGQIIAQDNYSSSGILIRRTINSFTRSNENGYTGINDGVGIVFNTDLDLYSAIKSSSKVQQNGNTYTTEYSDFNAYDVPQQTHEYNSFSGDNLYTKTDYLQDTSKWILNLPTQKYVSNSSSFGSAYSETTYDATYLKPYQEKLFGNVVATYSYDTQGDISQVTYNGSNRYEKFEDYYRGIPRKITLPCTTTNGCNTANGSNTNTVVALQSVNADGTISSITDFNGNKTSYGYNGVGWLTSINYADSRWADKAISYATVTSSGDGISGSDIPAGSLRQIISQGNYQKRVYHDGLLRPIFTREMDTSNSATARYQAFEYDANNQQTLASFVTASASNRQGVETEYDALGRTVNVTRTSDNSQTSTDYQANNTVAVTDGEGNTTYTSYLAYGGPSYRKPTLIEAPNTDDTSIAYNAYGQITQITQGGVTENRLYDSYQELCKSIRPETGITAYAYNAQRMPIWQAEGTSGSTSSCDPSSVPASHKTIIGYDNQGKLRTENFPDGNIDRTYSYDANGNLTQLSAGGVVWNYQYNSLNLLEKETLSLDSRSFVLDWTYDSLGSVSSLIYPSGASVAFSPNALGQPTQAGTYASGVSYFPNGQIKQFTYGNGIIRSVEQDSSGRMNLLTDTKSGALRNKLDLAYDRNDNLTQLLDLVDRNYDVTGLQYDGVDRLIRANGKWGSGSFSYDGLGNLLSRTYNSSTIGYQYNSRNLLNNLTGAYAYSYQYDARGNVTNNGRYGLSYNRAQQMTEAKSISYLYDGFNRKVKKTNSSGNAYTVYSKDGQLLYRTQPDTQTVDMVYVGGQLIAEVENCNSASCGSPNTQVATKSCASGYTLNSAVTLCQKNETISASISYQSSCPSGYTMSGSTCVKTESSAASVTTSYTCPNGGTANSSTGKCARFYTIRAKYEPTGAGVTCIGGFPGTMSTWDCSQTYDATQTQTYSCSSGWTLSGTTCSRTLTQAATATVVYSCSSGWTLSGSSCSRVLTSSVIYSCPSGWTLNGTQCVQ